MKQKVSVELCATMSSPKNGIAHDECSRRRRKEEGPEETIIFFPFPFVVPGGGQSVIIIRWAAGQEEERLRDVVKGDVARKGNYCCGRRGEFGVVGSLLAVDAMAVQQGSTEKEGLFSVIVESSSVTRCL